ncbi:NarK family nitrate/nitrite MFS transporter [Chitinophaga costaii]|nr:NarK family nitrate/nitrite MFS transporter [Chitinophaga costaii]
MRTFHITWLMFFVCFFGWFGLAPLMPAIREDLHLSKAQVGNIIIASVSSTIIARLLIGRFCDTWGPRKTAVALLLIGSLPVMLVGLARDYISFLLFRFAIGIIGASFVITQFHTAVMFAPRLKGTANALTGGWGNLGGGVTNMVMPLVFSAIVAMGHTPHAAWRYAMLLPGVMMWGVAWLYYRYTQDTPAGNYSDTGHRVQKQRADWSILRDRRVWVLALAYSVCFGMEITFDNVASLHFVDAFGLSQQQAGFWAGVFGFMNVFARALGGICADRIGLRYGLRGKGWLLAGVLLLEGIGLLLFAQAQSLAMAIGTMLCFALFLKMANGATYALVPFIQLRQVGLVSGVVGAGGNLGGMLFGFLFKSETLTYVQAFTCTGFIAVGVAGLVFLTHFARRSDEQTSTSPAPVLA